MAEHDSDGTPLSPPDSTLGKLQRGRGAGWLEALAGTGAVEEVLACVLADPRWDPQVESRAGYYAGLLGALGAPIDEIEAHARSAVEREVSLPIDVLQELARRGDERATRVLGELGVGALSPDRAEPTAVDRHRELRAALERLPADRLVTLAETPTSREGRIALRILGERDYAALLPTAIERLRARAADPEARGPEHVAYIRYLEELPAERVLPIARDWLDSPRPLSLAAECLFARHASADDRARLLATAELAFASGDMYRLCSMLDALARAPDPSLVPFLVQVCEGVDYSYARCRALRALAPLSSDAGAAASLREALWDCEADSRKLACEVADRASANVRMRLDEIADDPYEEHDVRVAARRGSP